MPLDASVFPEEIQVAFFMHNLISDKWDGMSGTYLGKNWIETVQIFDIYEIENKKEIPNELKNNLNDAIFGCDICQDVCPWNKFSKPHREESFNPKNELSSLKKTDWIELTEETFNLIFEGSAIKRANYNGLKRNINASR